MQTSDRHARVATLITLPLLLCLSSFTRAETPPPRGPMMDDAQRQQMMQQYGFRMMGPGAGMMNREGYGYGYGYGYGGRHMMGSGMMGQGMMLGMGPMMAVFDDLNLTREQHKQVWQLRRELRDQHMKLMDRMWEESEKMDDLSAKDKPDPKEVGKAYERIAAMQREMIEQNFAFRNKLYDLLNEEQRKKLKDYGPAWMLE